MARQVKKIPFHEGRNASSKEVARKAVYEDTGKYFLDVSKLIFGGVILAGVMNLEMDKFVLFLAGGASVLGSAIFGIILFKIGKE